jgi:biotin carboxyl carrier protein
VRLLPPKAFARGRELLGEGQAVAMIDGGSGKTTVTVPVGGLLDGMLVHEGEPVQTGQALMVVRMEGA